MIFDNGDVGATGIDVGDIGHSIRCRGDSVNCNLTRTPVAAGNLRKWTLSAWVKRSALTANYPSIFSATLNASYNDSFYFDPTDALVWNYSNSGTALVTTAKFRDIASHMHVVCVWDTDNATAALRARIFINGIELTAFSTDNRASLLNRDSTFNMSLINYIAGSSNASLAMRGYISRVCFVDGQALTPNSFGYLNTDINEWVSKPQATVKAVVDTGGVNSFMLDFDNGTSLTTLGYDKSSKGNHWTLNNFSLTPGQTYDWMQDVPGNSYATLNPLWKTVPSNAVLSDGNLAFSFSSGSGSAVFSNIPISGKSWAVVRVSNSGNGLSLGITSKATAVASSDVGAYGIHYLLTGPKRIYGTDTSYGASYTSTDVIAIQVDKSAGTIEFFKQTGGSGSFVSQGVITDSRISTDEHYFSVWNNSSSAAASGTVNFVQQPESVFIPSSGFTALCQANLPDPAIRLPKKHFTAKTRAGNSTAGTVVTNSDIDEVGLVWIKSRNVADDHRIANIITGGNKHLKSNTTDAEQTGTNVIQALAGNTYTLGSDQSVNGSGYNYIDWLFKAGGAPVANNAGSISSQVSANPLAGISIVTWTGNSGAGGTVGHGLGTTPSLIIARDRNAVANWSVYHKNANASPASGRMQLNLTDAFQTNSGIWGNTPPASSVFSVGSGLSGAATLFWALVFSEIPGFSKIGSYTGNGSADGPFVYCGFKPKFVLIKRVDAANSWTMDDAARSPYNQVGAFLLAESSAAEYTSDQGYVDYTANGFKIRSTATNKNASGGTYIYIAFADVPFKYANAR